MSFYANLNGAGRSSCLYFFACSLFCLFLVTPTVAKAQIWISPELLQAMIEYHQQEEALSGGDAEEGPSSLEELVSGGDRSDNPFDFDEEDMEVACIKQGSDDEELSCQDVFCGVVGGNCRLTTYRATPNGTQWITKCICVGYTLGN